MPKRRGMKFVFVFSGVVCLLFIAAWLRSHRTTDLLVWSEPGGRYEELVTIPGQFRWTRVSNWPGDQRLRWFAGRIDPLRPVFGQQLVARSWLPMGIGFDGGSRRINSPLVAADVYRPITVTYRITAVPFALPALITGAVALWPLYRRLRTRRVGAMRKDQGLCPACGYDIRATPGRCPECGKTISG